MAMLARISAPLVWLLDVSGKAVLRLLGGRQSADAAVTAEEIKSLIAEGESSGVIEPRERGMISAVMRLGDRPARAIMTPRHELDIVDLSLDPQALLRTVQASVHSRLLAWDPAANHAAGVVRKNDLLDAFIRDGTADPRALVRPAPIVPDTMDGFDVLDTLKNSPAHMVLVQDEYGELLGIVTTADILEAIVGAFQTDEGPAEPKARERDDGSWLVAGSMPADELIELLGISTKRTADFHTTAGMVLAAMRRLPKEGDAVVVGGWRFEVLDMDGRRIDKLLATRAKTVHRAANT